MSSEAIGPVSASPPFRAWLAIFFCHFMVTMLLGYGVLPRFESGIEPPPPPPSYAPILRGVIQAFYFPVVSWANRALVTGISRPGLGFVLVNSALVASAFVGIFVLVGRGKRAVA